MALFGEYRENIRTVLDECPEATKLQKLGFCVVTVWATRHERVLAGEIAISPYLKGPEVMWDTPDLDREVLEKELTEIKAHYESGSIS